MLNFLKVSKLEPIVLPGLSLLHRVQSHLIWCIETKQCLTLVHFDYGFSFQGPVEVFCGSITDCQLLGVGSGGSPCHMNNAWCLLTGIQPCLCWRLSYGDHSEHRQRRHRHSEERGGTEKPEQRDVQCSWQWNKTTRYLKGQLTQIKMFTNHCNYWFVFRKWDNYTESSLGGVYK